jgi:hypothetical protein
MGNGVPRRFTAEVIGAYLAGRRRGLTVQAAARAAGTTQESVNAWLRLGKAEPESAYGTFRRLEYEIRRRAATRLRGRLAARRELGGMRDEG